MRSRYVRFNEGNQAGKKIKKPKRIKDNSKALARQQKELAQKQRRQAKDAQDEARDIRKNINTGRGISQEIRGWGNLLRHIGG